MAHALPTDADLPLSAPRPEHLAAAVALNNAAEPHVNALEPDAMQWLITHATLALVVAAPGRAELAGLFIALPPTTAYQSLNYQWFKQRYPQGDFLYLDRIIVHPDYRRFGIGRRFYAALDRHAQGRAAYIACEVNIHPPNPGSMAFHQGLGFTEVGQQETEGGKKRVSLLRKAVAAR